MMYFYSVYFCFNFLSTKEFHNDAEKVWPRPVRHYYLDITLLHSQRKSASRSMHLKNKDNKNNDLRE
jgi:hypothetical protein